MLTSHAPAQDKLAQIRQLLEQNQADKAMQLIEKTGTQSRELKNAFGVCLLRLGRLAGAMDVLRELIFQNSMCIPKDTPPLFQANYATALLMKNYNQMAIEIINGLPADAHPYVAALQQAIADWKKQLSLFHQFRCLLGLYPAAPVILPFPPGDV